MATFTDDFNRANSGANTGLGANWQTYAEGTESTTGFEVLSNRCHIVAGFTTRTARYIGGTLTANQFCQAALAAPSVDGGEFVCVRKPDGNNYYGFGRLNDSTIRLIKMVAGVQSTLDTQTVTVATNDVLRLEANGTSLTGKINGVTVIGPITDGDLTTAGVGLRSSNTSDWDDWSGGDLGSSTTTVTPSTGAITSSGQAPIINNFTNVRYQEVLINAAGSPVSNRTGLRFTVWYSGQCAGAPDLSYSDLTTGAAGTASYSLASGSLALGQKAFGVITDGGASLSSYTCGLLTLTYS